MYLVYTPDGAEAGGEEALAAAGFRHLVPVAVEARRPGDLLLFRWRMGVSAKHAGILVTPERFLHAYDAAGGVVSSPLSDWWVRRLAFVFAFPGVCD